MPSFSISDPLLSMFDTANIGRLGSNSLAALGVCTSIFYLSFYGFLATKVIMMQNVDIHTVVNVTPTIGHIRFREIKTLSFIFFNIKVLKI